MPTKPLQSIRMIWFALLASNVLYPIICYKTKAANLGQPFPSDHPFFLPFAAIAAMAFGIAFVLPKIFFQNAKKKIEESRAQGREPNYLALYFTPWVIRMALLESITIYGLVLAMQTQNPVAVLPFALVSILAQLSQYPNEQKIKNTLEGATLR